jgi:hypothetical protein
MKILKVYESFDSLNEGLKINDAAKENLAKKAVMMLAKVKAIGSVTKFEDAKGNKWELGVVASANGQTDTLEFNASDFILSMEYVNKATNMSGGMGMGDTFQLHDIKKLKKDEVLIMSISQL